MKRLNLAMLAATAMLSFPLAAQDDRFDNVEITSEKLAPGVAVLFGAGGNIGLSYGEDGTVMIDDQYAPLTEKILAEVKALGAGPVKFLINTHWHGDHSGGNENMGKAGAIIMAQHNVRIRMVDGKQSDGSINPSPKIALPVVTYADGLKLHLNGEEIRLIGLSPAHTDGDTLIHWSKSNVIHMGDTFFNKMSYPFIDLRSGADVRGFLDAADTALKIADADTVIIPGHGKVATTADLRAYRDMLFEIITKVGAAMQAGKSLDEIKVMRPAHGYGVNEKGFITPDVFVEAVYKSLMRGAKPM